MKTPRNYQAIALRLYRSVKFAHRCEPRGGANNEQAELMAEYDESKEECFDCGENQCCLENRLQQFKYDDKLLEAVVPVWVCRNCQAMRTDWRAENVREKIVNEMLRK